MHRRPLDLHQIRQNADYVVIRACKPVRAGMRDLPVQFAIEFWLEMAGSPFRGYTPAYACRSDPKPHVRMHMPCVPLCREDSCRAAAKGENRRFSTRCARARSASGDQPGARAQGTQWPSEERSDDVKAILIAEQFTRSEATVVKQRLPAEVSVRHRSTFSRASRRSKICFGFSKRNPKGFRLCKQPERHARKLNLDLA